MHCCTLTRHLLFWLKLFWLSGGRSAQLLTQQFLVTQDSMPQSMPMRRRPAATTSKTLKNTCNRPATAASKTMKKKIKRPAAAAASKSKTKKKIKRPAAASLRFRTQPRPNEELRNLVRDLVGSVGDLEVDSQDFRTRLGNTESRVDGIAACLTSFFDQLPSIAQVMPRTLPSIAPLRGPMTNQFSEAEAFHASDRGRVRDA